jgi:regulator of protease activity HflC (stomatin/prohibitin superfamily)
MDPNIPLGIFIGFVIWFLVSYLAGGIYTVNQNERAVKTNFGRADRIGTATTLNSPISQSLDAEEKQRYNYPQVRVIMPGGPYFKWPWQKVYKVSVSTQTINMAYDPEFPKANMSGTVVEAVTKDQLNTGMTGQIRYRISEKNLYAYLFGVKNPIAHVMAISFRCCVNALPLSKHPPNQTQSL